MWYDIFRMQQFLDNIKTYWPWYLSALLLLSAVIVAISLYAAIANSYIRWRVKVADKSNSARAIIIDLDTQNVSYFDVKNPRELKVITLSDFYGQFPIARQKQMGEWLEALADDKEDTPRYFESDVAISRTKRSMFSVLEVDEVNKEKRKIHLTSHLLRYLPPDLDGSVQRMTSMKDFSAAVRSSSKTKGISFCASFDYKRTSMKGSDLDPLVFKQVKNALFQLLDGPRSFLIEASKNELILSNLKISERPQGMFIVKLMQDKIRRYLSLNSLTNQIDMRIGVVEHKYFPNDAAHIIDEARKTARLCFESNEEVIWFSSDETRNYTFIDSAYRSEIERIISEKKLSFLFRPIYDVDDAETIAYIAKVVPTDAFFSSVEELKIYAERAEEGRSLFSTIARHLIPTFYMGKTNQTDLLYFPTMVSELPYVLTTFSRLSQSKGCNISLLLSEDDVKNHLGDTGIAGFKRSFASIRSRGYQISLLLNGNELGLPDQMYELFDSYIVSFAFAGSSTGLDAKVRSELHALVEKLIKYQRPIISSDIDGWDAIELLVRSGIRYISADAFAPYDEMMSPISARNARRIKNMTK